MDPNYAQVSKSNFLNNFLIDTLLYEFITTQQNGKFHICGMVA